MVIRQTSLKVGSSSPIHRFMINTRYQRANLHRQRRRPVIAHRRVIHKQKKQILPKEEPAVMRYTSHRLTSLTTLSLGRMPASWNTSASINQTFLNENQSPSPLIHIQVTDKFSLAMPSPSGYGPHESIHSRKKANFPKSGSRQPNSPVLDKYKFSAHKSSRQCRRRLRK